MSEMIALNLTHLKTRPLLWWMSVYCEFPNMRSQFWMNCSWALEAMSLSRFYFVIWLGINHNFISAGIEEGMESIARLLLNLTHCLCSFCRENDCWDVFKLRLCVPLFITSALMPSFKISSVGLDMVRVFKSMSCITSCQWGHIQIVSSQQL